MSNRVKKAREVKIYSYAEAQQRGESLLKFSDVNDSKGVGVCILVMPDGNIYPIYCLVKENKIYSLLVLRKGEIAIGWL